MKVEREKVVAVGAASVVAARDVESGRLGLRADWGTARPVINGQTCGERLQQTGRER